MGVAYDLAEPQKPEFSSNMNHRWIPRFGFLRFEAVLKKPNIRSDSRGSIVPEKTTIPMDADDSGFWQKSFS